MMVHFDFLTLEGSFRGFSTALHRLISNQVWGSRMLGRNSPDCFIEYLFETELRQGRALDVLPCLDVLAKLQTLCVGYRRHLLLSKLIDRSLILSQIALGSDKDDGNARRMVANLWIPLCMRVSRLFWSQLRRRTRYN